jgi:hypothetical protein
LPAYWTFLTLVLVDELSVPGPARARIATAIENIACIAVSLSALEDEGSKHGVTPRVDRVQVENIS